MGVNDARELQAMIKINGYMCDIWLSSTFNYTFNILRFLWHSKQNFKYKKE